MIQRIPDDEGVLMLNLIPFTPEEKTLINGRSMSNFTTLVREALTKTNI